jgi:hypothetical protein
VAGHVRQRQHACAPRRERQVLRAAGAREAAAVAAHTRVRTGPLGRQREPGPGVLHPPSSCLAPSLQRRCSAVRWPAASTTAAARPARPTLISPGVADLRGAACGRALGQRAAPRLAPLPGAPGWFLLVVRAGSLGRRRQSGAQQRPPPSP